MRYALRSDVCGALFETHRALEVLLAWLVLPGCDPTQDEYREDPKARSHVLSHRSYFLPRSTLPRASRVIDLRCDGVAIGRTGYGTAEWKSTCHRTPGHATTASSWRRLAPRARLKPSISLERVTAICFGGKRLGTPRVRPHPRRRVVSRGGRAPPRRVHAAATARRAGLISAPSLRGRLPSEAATGAGPMAERPRPPAPHALDHAAHGGRRAHASGTGDGDCFRKATSGRMSACGGSSHSNLPPSAWGRAPYRRSVRSRADSVVRPCTAWPSGGCQASMRFLRGGKPGATAPGLPAADGVPRCWSAGSQRRARAATVYERGVDTGAGTCAPNPCDRFHLALRPSRSHDRCCRCCLRAGRPIRSAGCRP